MAAPPRGAINPALTIVAQIWRHPDPEAAMRAALILCWLLLATAAPATAGPWARAEGDILVIATLEDKEAGAEAGLYAELGLGTGWTAGADLGLPEAGIGAARGFVFLGRSFGTGPARLGLELGAGVATDDGARKMLWRPGVSFGQGFGGDLPGWASLALSREGSRDKAVATLGLRPAEGLATIVQLQREASGSDAAALHLAPSIVYRATPGAEVEVGLRRGIGGPAGDSLRLGTWFSF
jgi:hypothetical protein